MSTISKAVLPVAGLGTRFLPITRSVPKEMLPIVDRPCLEYAVVEAVEAGLDELIFVTARGKGALEDYFDRDPGLEARLEAAGKREALAEIRRIARYAKIASIRQPEPLGLGHAVLCAAPLVRGEGFAVLLGDFVFDAPRPAIGQLLSLQEARGGCAIGLERVPAEQAHRYGICAGPEVAPGVIQIEQMVEKPPPGEAPGDQSVIGRYVVPGELLEILARTPPGRGGEIQLTDALAVLAGRGEAWGLEIAGSSFDTGQPVGWLAANLHFALKRPDTSGAVRALIQEYSDRS